VSAARLVIARDDPRRDDVRALLALHLAFADEHSAPEGVHALDVDGLLDPDLTFFSGRVDAALVVVGALRRLGADHAEIKSMHTRGAARGRGYGRAMLEHLLGVARSEGLRRVSLETGTMAAFDAARHLYTSAGFTQCPSFADYPTSRKSTCMTLRLEPPGAQRTESGDP
jgi:putative acetyltransferase